MTATSSVSVPRGALDSSHMSTWSSSGLGVQSWHGEGAWRWASQGGSGRGGAPGRAWSRSVVLLVSLIFLFVSAHAQTPDQYKLSRNALNRQIHYQAFSFFNRTKIETGKIYNASLPTGINNNSVELEAIQMVRLRSGSLKRYGINMSEIHLLPQQVMLVQPLLYVVLVYRRFKQYSYYDTTNGTEFVAPVVGIMVYNYNDVRNYTNYGQELTVVSIGSPIQVQLKPTRNIALDRQSCILYNNTAAGTATGVVENVTSSGVCQWSILGDFALLGPPTHSSSNTWKVVVGAVVGGLAALVLLILVAFLALWYREKSKFADMEHKSDQGESLHHTWFGTSRAPSAAGTRTKPILENENV